MTDGVGLIGLMVAANNLKLGLFPLRVLSSGEIVPRASGFLVDVVVVVDVVRTVVVVVLAVVVLVVVAVVVVDGVVPFVVDVTALSSLSAVKLSSGARDDWDLNTSGLVRGLLVEITLGSARCLVSVLVGGCLLFI